MPWTKPTRPKAYREFKELWPVFGHNTVRKDLGPEVRSSLDSIGVLWTTTGVIRFIKVRAGEAIGPATIWIGVTPETLSIKVTHTTVHSCMGRIEKLGMGDVRVESQESNFTRSAGASFKPGSDPT
ncbi:hypothetical protein BS47DRAFT_1396382 [Hydnum rufescens UP504]|uniref:Uncharacterized protein n=1 Tax=Hydnum rufescens UP504 TaxID=1448309 RepID=A0A9P6AQC0_9AGAM|nr:hypothetical protein BS47DRAFT_1396382 [Hydnum rufescens UP504]